VKVEARNLAKSYFAIALRFVSHSSIYINGKKSRLIKDPRAIIAIGIKKIVAIMA
jgi:hypothetical protein